MSERASQQNLEEVYGRSYQEDSISEERVPSWAHIAQVLQTYFEPRTHLDIGAGAGPLVRAMLARGVDSWGIEGSPFGAELGGKRIITHDLRTPLLLVNDSGEPPPYDLVTCFDTAEHVEDGGCVVEICAETAREWIVFGAAPPGQDGLGHCFLQPPEYWHEQFERHGFGHQEPLTMLIRQLIAANEIHNKVWWCERNLCVYQRRLP